MFKLKKVSPRRALACLLAMFALLTVFTALAESSQEAAEAPAVETAQSADSPWVTEVIQPSEEKAAEVNRDPDINFLVGLKNIAMSTGIAKSFTDSDIDFRNYIMMAVACLLLYLAIVKQFEPLLLLPIAFGMLLANLPAAGMMGHPSYTYFNTMEEALAAAKQISKDAGDIVMRARTVTDPVTGVVTNTMMPALETSNGGLLYYLYKGVKLGIYPPLIFMGVGAMTDFAPLIANPKSLLLGAAAQLGIFLTFLGAKLLGFSAMQAGAIGIIGGADGPTAIFVTTRLAPELLGPIAVAAYSYMALVPVIQPPIMRALTTE